MLQSFTRRNLIDFTFIFTANDGSNTQPSAAILALSYLAEDGSGIGASIVNLFMLQGEQWVGTWDSSVATSGRVDWSVTCSGPLFAVEEDSFTLVANAANN